MQLSIMKAIQITHQTLIFILQPRSTAAPAPAPVPLPPTHWGLRAAVRHLETLMQTTSRMRIALQCRRLLAGCGPTRTLAPTNFEFGSRFDLLYPLQLTSSPGARAAFSRWKNLASKILCSLHGFQVCQPCLAEFNFAFALLCQILHAVSLHEFDPRTCSRCQDVRGRVRSSSLRRSGCGHELTLSLRLCALILHATGAGPG